MGVCISLLHEWEGTCRAPRLTAAIRVPESDLTGVNGEHTEMQEKSWDRLVWTLGWRRCGTLEAQCVYYIQLKREAS